MRFSPSCVFTFALACGPSVNDDTNATGEDSGTATSAGSDGALDDAADASPTSGDPTYCDPAAGVDPLQGADCDTLYFGPDSSLRAITVRITNETAASIVVPAHTQPPALRYFAVAGTMASRVVATVSDPCPVEWTPPACAAFSEDGVACDAIGHPPNPSVVIEPGAVFEQAWEPLLAAEAELPGECTPNDEPVSCVTPVVARAGAYQATSRAYPLAACGPACVCEPNDFGWCETTGLVETGEALQATGDWNGQCAVLDVVFTD